MTPARTEAAEALHAARAAVTDDLRVTGAALREGLCAAADGWLRDQLAGEADVAVVAVGGYGRREPAPGSDLDLLLLHRGRADIKALADRLWYPVWDAGVGLDHSVRTPAEALAVAREDLKAVLGLLDARHVAGDPQLTDEVRSGVLAGWRRDARRRLPEVAAAVRDRADRAGELAFLLEPDLKECRGGLRDVHAMTAAAAAWVVDAADEKVRAAHERLLDVRGELHRRMTRPSDRLLLQEQAPLAVALGYADADELMRAVYDAGRAIAFASDDTWRRVDAALRPARSARPGRRWPGRGGARSGVDRRPLADDVVEQDGEVVLARDARPSTDAVLPWRVAAAAAQAGLPVSRHTLRRLAAECPALPEPWPDAARNALVALLEAGPPAVAVLEALDQSGLLVRALPEWDNVRCKPQRNAVHRFTVDRHLVEAAVEASRLTRRVNRPDLLVLAALLHDIGKGFPGDHTDAGVQVVPAMGRRMGLAEPDVDVLVALVRHHLLLPDTATRRDLDDPVTVQAVADAVRDRETLDLLRALTEADALATGPAAWSEWKSRLVDDLVARARVVLAGQPPPSPPALDERQLELARAARLDVDVTGDRVTIIAPDRPGLLWRWAGVLALHRLEIRAATAMSIDRVAVSVLHVSPRFGAEPEWERLRADVRRAYDDALPMEARLAERERAYARAGDRVPPRVVWVDDASADASVVEVRAHDAIGLLHRLTRALADAGLDVRTARVSTLGAEVVDAFYVVDRDGSLVDDDARRADIEKRLLIACGAAADPPSTRDQPRR